ncbi:NifU family protein [Paenibacillus xylanivorans]|jgi:Fe-S cluster biogenesis protein NfuA|uniref:Nitrogen fixation protein NifU n=1 Tax=Paenibacillus xylanivorans TaxID=1705561 RepID=A0A0N0C5W5_9BACL|nr:NifU family protein [Paenibacillus xylanivorans]KOY17814.1 nitrogen fixation protein NifU [Paenibacillus xylanivorans]KOY17830.1 nitrogen fixation protein NifU [Paenibacillus xylanivorans]KOY18181.1 nitrogen fixation protein NifU [Paenibacillus xylanivorans]
MRDSEELFEEVDDVLRKLRPFLMRDNGDAELVEVKYGVAKLKFLGECNGCPSATITLKAGIERAIFEEVDGIHEVVQVF